jgi:hypothetical protein
MKLTVVPAQVTTIEDKIAGNLTLPQLLILSAPVFSSAVFYALLPPTLRVAVYKMVLIGLSFLVCGFLAIRFKGKLIIVWLLVLLRYNYRPKYYVYDKRSACGRTLPSSTKTVTASVAETNSVNKNRTFPLSLEDIIRTEQLLNDSGTKVDFNSRKGGLYVRVTQIRS